MDIEDNWPFDRIQPDQQEAIYDLLVAIETELDYVDVMADELQEQRFMGTATTRELEKLAAEVGVNRETNESESAFRFRAQLRKAVSKSNGTFPDFAQVLAVVFGDDVINTSLTPASDTPVVEVNVPSELLDELPVTTSELEQELQRAIPVGHNVVIVASDSWVLGESGDQGLGKGGLV